jgi:hypothetical protein
LRNPASHGNGWQLCNTVNNEIEKFAHLPTGDLDFATIQGGPPSCSTKVALQANLALPYRSCLEIAGISRKFLGMLPQKRDRKGILNTMVGRSFLMFQFVLGDMFWMYSLMRIYKNMMGYNVDIMGYRIKITVD